ncbi:MAG: transglycosylase SLT domain-containing protein, partial [Bacteroidales bacterium]
MKIKKSIWLFLSIFTMLSCQLNTNKDKDIAQDKFDLPQIVERDTLTILTLYSSTSYFIYRGDEMGYDFELAKDYAEDHGLNLKVVVAENINKLQEMLLRGEGDLIAYEIPEVSNMKDSLIFCGRKSENYQVLVQRTNGERPLIDDVTDLSGDSVYIIKDTHFEDRLYNLNEEIGGGISIIPIGQDTIVSEDLIEMVSKGEIPYT